MSDRESDVRDTASKSLSLLMCFCDDKDKLTSLVDSCLDVIVDDTIPIDNGLQVITGLLPHPYHTLTIHRYILSSYHYWQI